MKSLACTVGYNDFNNLVMQTLWWLHSKILRNIHNKRFSVFLNRFLRICNQSLKKVLIWPEKKLVWKIQKRCQKTQNFTLISNPLKKLKKCTQKKVISKNVTFTHVRQTCFAYNFCLVHFFKTFSTDSKFCVFWHFF